MDTIKSFSYQIVEQYRIPQRKWVFQGAAVAVCLLLCFTIYKTFIERPYELEKIPKDFKITLTAINPIVIETEDVDRSLEKIKSLIKVHEGHLLQILFTDRGVEVTFRVREDKEKALLNEFNELGKVHINKQGYKSKEGNIVVLLVK